MEKRRGAWTLTAAAFFHQARPLSTQNVALIRAIDELHLVYPQFGSRRLMYWLQREGWAVNRKRVQQLMRRMGLAPNAVCRGRMPSIQFIRTSRATSGHPAQLSLVG